MKLIRGKFTDGTPHYLLSYELPCSSTWNRPKKFHLFQKQLDIFCTKTPPGNRKQKTPEAWRICQTLSSYNGSCYPIANRRLWFKSVHSCVYFTGTFQIKSIGIMTIFRHFNTRSFNFTLTFNTIFTIFRIRQKKFVCNKETKKTWLSYTNNSEDRPTADYLYHPRFPWKSVHYT